MYGGKLKQYKDFVSFRNNFIQAFPELAKESKFHIQAAYAFLNMKINDIVVVSRGNHIVDAIGIIRSDYYWDDKNDVEFVHFRKVDWIAKDINTSPDRFLRKQISQMTIYEFYKADIKIEAFEELTPADKINGIQKAKPYVLIIDEINRGNVSQIFGELITLIEEDKRLGSAEALEVMLPYSKTSFGVPPNLYIIGTMNTADRSVEALDTALRRRFSFEEMPPNPNLLTPSNMFWRLLKQYPTQPWNDEKYLEKERDLLQVLGSADNLDSIKVTYWEQYEKSKHDQPEFESQLFTNVNLCQLLNAINTRIECLLDKDHLIGHSFFISIGSWSDLQGTFYKNIIPLLQEYFYGDYGKIGLVLGDGFVKKKGIDDKLFANFSSYGDTSAFTEREVYEIVDYRYESQSYSIEIDKKPVPMNFEKAIKRLLNANID